MVCQGTTRLLLTKIPFFREIILMSFYCDHCHFKNTEVQPAGAIQERGSKYTFKASQPDDLERQVVKSDTSVFRIEDLDIEIPPGRGRLTNVEGIISDVLKDLEAGQQERKKLEPEIFDKIAEVVQSLIKLINSARFTISLDDPAGNSWIEPNVSVSEPKDKYSHTQYSRTHEQNVALGLGVSDEGGANEAADASREPEGSELEDVNIIEGQVYDLPVECPGCTKPAHYMIQMIDIPYFKQVYLMTTKCELCGYHVSDCKTGGEVPTKGKRTWLHVKGPDDLRRDILKSESCMLQIKGCDVEVVPGTMAGRFTTVEGLLTQIRDDLLGNIYGTGIEEKSDSMPTPLRKRWREVHTRLEKAIKGEMEFTILMQDPLAGSYCQTFGEPGEDKQVREEDYERTAEEEEELGLADMKTHLNEHGEYVKEPAGKENKSLAKGSDGPVDTEVPAQTEDSDSSEL